MSAESKRAPDGGPDNSEYLLVSIELGQNQRYPRQMEALTLASYITKAYESAGAEKTLAAVRSRQIRDNASMDQSKFGLVSEAARLLTEQYVKGTTGLQGDLANGQFAQFCLKVKEIGRAVRHDPKARTAMVQFVEATFGQRYPDVWRRDQQNRGLAQKAFTAVRGLFTKKPDVGLDPVTLEERTPGQP